MVNWPIKNKNNIPVVFRFIRLPHFALIDPVEKIVKNTKKLINDQVIYTYRKKILTSTEILRMKFIFLFDLSEIFIYLSIGIFLG
jgi:hypothetical protein